MSDNSIPVSINVAGVDVVGAFQTSDWLEAHASGFIGHDVHQSVLEFVAREIGCDKPGCVGFGVSQPLEEKIEQKNVGRCVLRFKS